MGLYMRKSASVLMAVITGFLLSSTAPSFAREKPRTPPIGFLLAIGGGASAGLKGPLKPALHDLHKMALTQLQKQRAAGARVGEKACFLDYHPDSPETQETIQFSKQFFMQAGLKAENFSSYIIDTTAKANDFEMATKMGRECGLLFVPGGDQTEMRNLWSRTRLQRALGSILKNGGGLMGKSAGAAIQGSLNYFPRLDSETTAGSLLKRISLHEDEMETDFLTGPLSAKGLPRIYIETHAGDRERTGRALALLSYWEETKPYPEKRAIGIAVDSDTGVLISYDSSLERWTAEVGGARVAEFLVPRSTSRSFLTTNGQASYSDVNSTVLLAKEKLALPSFIGKKRFAQKSHVPLNAFIQKDKSSSKVEISSFYGDESGCYSRLPETISGEDFLDMDRASSISFSAWDEELKIERAMEEVESAFISGNLREKRGTGCGYWLAHSFDPDFGQPENRLNAQRYALAGPTTTFSVSLPKSMRARKSSEGFVTFEEQTENGSSLLILDVKFASDKKRGTYIYTESGATKPVQVGGWKNGRAHLLVSGARFQIETGIVEP
jgi:cyanophycinase-like exopeptidase